MPIYKALNEYCGNYREITLTPLFSSPAQAVAAPAVRTQQQAGPETV